LFIISYRNVVIYRIDELPSGLGGVVLDSVADDVVVVVVLVLLLWMRDRYYRIILIKNCKYRGCLSVDGGKLASKPNLLDGQTVRHATMCCRKDPHRILS
jgi:hypothetical protein